MSSIDGLDKNVYFFYKNTWVRESITRKYKRLLNHVKGNQKPKAAGIPFKGTVYSDVVRYKINSPIFISNMKKIRFYQ